MIGHLVIQSPCNSIVTPPVEELLSALENHPKMIPPYPVMEEGDGNRLGKASTTADCNSRKVAEWNSKSLLQFNRRLQQKLYGDEAQVKPINVVYDLLPKSKKKDEENQ
ncbi:hypothetical protein LIER_44128 [Lithospermum erythrorhizon]|uniref:Uncharacterized protein n=1 Tax=Lithospermum erythrorhizon TaxID=34254 RepID=A0AAV3Q516_LITER